MKKTTIMLVLAVWTGGCGGDDTGDGTTGGTTGGSGDIPCAGPSDPNSGRVPCPGGSPAADTALPTLAELRTVADGTGETVKWLGGVLGQQIARDGTPTGGMLTLWTAGFCLGGTSSMDIGDGLNVSTNGIECLAQRQCMTLDCSASPDYPFPVVDSDAAIATAFPMDAAGATYGLSYTAAVGDFWSVSSNGTTVKVDATTGMIIP